MSPHKNFRLGVGLLALTLAAGCGRHATEPPRPAPLSKPTATSDVLDCTGTLRPVSVFALHLKPNEMVDKIRVKAGDQVQAGAVLVVLSCPELQTEWLTVREKALSLRREAGQLDLCRRKKSVAESRLSELQKRLEVEESLRAKVPGHDPQAHARPLLDEKTRVEEEIQTLAQEITLGTKLVAEATPVLKSLEERLPFIEERLANLIVKAPFAGTVVRAEPVPDPADGVLLELHDRARFSVHGVLWQNQLSVVEKGSLVTVIPDFMPGQSWTGTVASIGFVPVAGSVGAFPRFPVVVSLDAGIDTTPFRDGMTAFMHIQRATTNGLQSQPGKR